MALNIKSDQADRLARELAAACDESITEAVTTAIEERLRRRRRDRGRIAARLRSVRDDVRALPRLDERSDDEILGYDEHGLPTGWWWTARRS